MSTPPPNNNNNNNNNTNTIVTYKEIGPSLSNFQCRVLKSTNYTVWAIRTKTILEANGLWEMIEPTVNTVEDVKKDKAATAYLFQALSKELIIQVASCKSAKEVWDTLKIRHVDIEQVQKARLQTIKTEFDRMQMKKDETIDSFTARLSSIVTRATSCDFTFDQPTLVRKLLNSIPNRFIQIVASIEQFTNLDTVTLDETVGRLKTFEERIKSRRANTSDNHDKILFTKHDNKAGQIRQFGNHGQKKFNPSRKKWHNKYNKQSGDNSSHKNNPNKPKCSNKTSKVKCYNYQKFGHYANDCTQEKKVQEQSNLIKEDEEPTLLMAVINEDIKNEEILLNEK
ncbi:hypothetical protein E3N88_09413 [Mikania micrantha]|uniref:Uncharacterized protein n=1 Tax=Mikania micrantha TaxID=192012 RepID=A0A5N6PJV3_9ASTR|nr:hypothetical protein E3N88_09413 [Mikania micrantha]